MNKKKVMAVAIALPSIILSVALSVFYLIEKKVITNLVGLMIILASLFSCFYLMVKHVISKKNK